MLRKVFGKEVWREELRRFPVAHIIGSLFSGVVMTAVAAYAGIPTLDNLPLPLTGLAYALLFFAFSFLFVGLFVLAGHGKRLWLPHAGVPTTRSVTAHTSNSASDSIKNRVPPTEPSEHNLERWSAAEIDALDRIFRIIQDDMLPAYDKLGDKHASPWRGRILEIGPKAYLDELQAGLRDSSQAGRKLHEFLEKQAIYPNLVEAFKGWPEQHNKLVAAVNVFQAEVLHLSDKPEDRNLNLVETEATMFQSAVGAYGQWVRGRIQRAIELKQTVAPVPAGTWKGNKFIYDTPQLVYTLSFGPDDDGKTYRVRVDRVEPKSFVQFKIEYDGGVSVAAIIPHEKQQINWPSLSRDTQYGIRLSDIKTTVLAVHAPPKSDLTIIRLSILWWERPK